jgi:hypothetical protein
VSRFRVPTILAGALVLATLAAGNALARSDAFSASYSGKVTEKVDGTKVTAFAKGSGTGTPVGKGTITGTVVASTANPPCSPFDGPGLISGSKGKLKVKVLPISRACAAGQDDQNNISVAGSAKVVGGTGKFRTAKGTLRFTGHYDRGSGAFTVKLKGTLKY